MFDVGFWELLFIFTLALVVLGPDKLPAVVSTLGRWTGRARALARGLRVQIERELAADQTVMKPPSKAHQANPAPAASKPPGAGAGGEEGGADASTAAGAAFAPAAGSAPAGPGDDAPREPATPGADAPERRDER